MWLRCCLQSERAKEGEGLERRVLVQLRGKFAFAAWSGLSLGQAGT